MRNTMRVLAFSWNTESIRFSDDQSPQQWVMPPEADAQFIHRMTDMVKEKDPHILVISLQEDAKPGSHLMSQLLPNALCEIGYCLIRRTRLMGMGVSTWKAICRGDLKFRGLRLAIYARRSWLAKQGCTVVIAPEKYLNVQENFTYCTGIYQFTCGKGAVSFGIDLPKIGRLKIINLHLPFDASSILGDESERLASINYQNDMLNKVYDDLVDESDDFLLMMGDFNYRIVCRPGESATDILENIVEDPKAVLESRDELYLCMQSRKIPLLHEGPDNCGPLFLPTAKLRTGTRDDAFNVGKSDRRVPSWCDRIMYRALSDDVEIECDFYKRWRRLEGMAGSDHAPLWSMFSLSRPEDRDFEIA